MKLLRREWLHRYRCRLYKSPVVSGALGDTALRGWTVKWIRSLEIGNSRPRFLLAPAIVLMLALSLSAAAENQYYVSTTGSNSNSGTSPSKPWQTISFAVANANLSGGATILVHAGTYTENIPCGGHNGPLCMNRSGPSTTQRFRIECDTQWSVPSGSGCLLRNSSSSGGMIANANNVDIVGFDYTNPNSAVGAEARCTVTSGQCPQGNSVHLINNYLHDIGQNINDDLGGPGCPSFGAIFVGSTRHSPAFQTDIQIIGNRISNYGDQTKAPRNGGSCNFTQGIYANTPGAVIENNIVIQVAAYGIHFYSAPCNGVISNNTVDQAGKSDIIVGGGDCSPQGKITINNNILGAAPSGGIFLGASGVAPCTSSSRIKVSNNLFASGSSQINGSLNGCTDVSGSLTEAPTDTFVSYSATSRTNDYHLKAGSQAISHGTTACTSGVSNCVNPLDFDRITRLSPPSIGSYDFGGASAESPRAPTGLTATVQ
jgi:hypothetical protein